MPFGWLSLRSGNGSSSVGTNQWGARLVLEARASAVNISQEVRHYIEQELITDAREGSVGPNDDLLTLGIIDSLGLMRLTSFLEESYGLTITDSELTPENFRSVSTITAFVVERIDGSSAAA